MFSFRFVGALLLRFAQRKLSAFVLFQEPPRSARRFGSFPAQCIRSGAGEPNAGEDRAPQSEGVGVPGMTEPRRDALLYLRERQFPRSVVARHAPQTPGEAIPGCRAQSPVRREYAIAEERDAQRNGGDELLARASTSSSRISRAFSSMRCPRE